MNSRMVKQDRELSPLLAIRYTTYPQGKRQKVNQKNKGKKSDTYPSKRNDIPHKHHHNPIRKQVDPHCIFKQVKLCKRFACGPLQGKQDNYICVLTSSQHQMPSHQQKIYQVAGSFGYSDDFDEYEGGVDCC